MKMKRFNPRLMTITAMLAALSSVLMLLQFPLPIFPGFLQFDFSDLPALIGAFSFGPAAGVAIVLIKNAIHLTVTSTGGVGELSNFLVWSSFVFTAGFLYKRFKTRNGALLAMGVSVVVMAITGILVNYFITIPFYARVMIPLDAIIGICAAIIPSVDSLLKIVLLSITPFNLFKGIILCLVTFLTYKRLSWLIHGKTKDQ
jgi:riboflavin transporter FmnP